MRTLARRFERFVQFVFVYSRDAHMPLTALTPYLAENTPVRQAANLEERRTGAGLLRQAVEPERLLLLDGFRDQSVYERCFAGTGADDSAVLIGTDGRVLLVERWTDPNELEDFLNQILLTE